MIQFDYSILFFKLNGLLQPPNFSVWNLQYMAAWGDGTSNSTSNGSKEVAELKELLHNPETRQDFGAPIGCGRDAWRNHQVSSKTVWTYELD